VHRRTCRLAGRAHAGPPIFSPRVFGAAGRNQHRHRRDRGSVREAQAPCGTGRGTRRLSLLAQTHAYAVSLTSPSAHPLPASASSAARIRDPSFEHSTACPGPRKPARARTRLGPAPSTARRRGLRVEIDTGLVGPGRDLGQSAAAECCARPLGDHTARRVRSVRPATRISCALLNSPARDTCDSGVACNFDRSCRAILPHRVAPAACRGRT